MLRRHACSLSPHLLLVVEAELARIYDDILALLDSRLVLSASASESKVINMEFGIVEGLMMTVHATTDDVVLLDEDDDDEDDTYIDDGVAPFAVESIEDDFFV
ncbi:unnamed protein product [Miscanthus lutarioriparius]|uniref:Glyceraldehyde 3-phosphate dehydrogenase catalytic domain-containing protein n=1 Tax=Miscanthus lutarioriparius TaxID=422564 RepID=A0A811S8S6_9POAL|nr:unnamed protein product [Miscanthus lutarioriparius]